MIYVAYTFALLLAVISLFAVLIILMQRPSTNAGMGAALGGGAAESAFGGDAANVLSKLTYSLIALFFIISFGLFLGFLVESKSSHSSSLDALIADETASPAPQVTPAVTPAQDVAPAPVDPATPTTPATPTPQPTSTPAPAQ